MKRFVVLASIAPLLLIPAGAVALPSGLPSPDDSVTELEAKDDTVVTSIPDGVSLDDIRTAENTEKLTTALHDILGYEASLQAGSDPSTVVLNWKGEVPAELAELQQNPPAGTELIIRKSKYSEDELRKAGAALLLNARAKSGEPLIAYVTPAEDFSGLKASVRGEADDTRSTNELEADLERIAGTPVTIRSRQASVTGLARQNDSSPWFGAGIMRKDSTNSTCSLGVAAVTPGGYGRLISAAHCDPGGNAAWRTAAGTLITSGGTNVTVRHPSIDAMRIDPEGGTSPKVWSGGYGSSSSRWVTGAGGSAAGDALCTGGANSGDHCNALVTEMGAQILCPGDSSSICNGHIVKRSDNSATSTHGDSGGPVYRVRADGSAGVRGIISAGIYDVAADRVSCPSTAFSPGGNCWRRTFFIPIRNITDYWTDLEVELH